MNLTRVHTMYPSHVSTYVHEICAGGHCFASIVAELWQPHQGGCSSSKVN